MQSFFQSGISTIGAQGIERVRGECTVKEWLPQKLDIVEGSLHKCIHVCGEV